MPINIKNTLFSNRTRLFRPRSHASFKHATHSTKTPTNYWNMHNLTLRMSAENARATYHLKSGGIRRIARIQHCSALAAHQSSVARPALNNFGVTMSSVPAWDDHRLAELPLVINLHVGPRLAADMLGLISYVTCSSLLCKRNRVRGKIWPSLLYLVLTCNVTFVCFICFRFCLY